MGKGLDFLVDVCAQVNKDFTIGLFDEARHQITGSNIKYDDCFSGESFVCSLDEGGICTRCDENCEHFAEFEDELSFEE